MYKYINKYQYLGNACPNVSMVQRIKNAWRSPYVRTYIKGGNLRDDVLIMFRCVYNTLSVIFRYEFHNTLCNNQMMLHSYEFFHKLVMAFPLFFHGVEIN